MSDLFAELKAVLETTPTRWSALAAAFPAEALRCPPLPDEWSALECLQHLIDTERYVFPVRVESLLAGKNFPGFFPAENGNSLSDAAPLALAEEFALLRQRSLGLLATVTPADLDRQAIHGELGPVTLRELLHEWGGHDLMHTIQAEQALMQPFIAGCGPWRDYFSLHIARGSLSAADQGET